MPVPLATIASVCLASGIWMLVFYALRRMVHNAGIVDAGWALGVGLAAIAYAGTGGGDPFRRLLLGLLAGIWSFRLGFFILRDRVLKGKEDGRYRSLMDSWGEMAERKLFQLFLIQAVFIVLFSIPFLPVVGSPARLFTFWDILGLAVWLAAIAGESIADWQLASWRANPDHQGQTCRYGLWKYSRHPNYFFEWVHWWAYVFLAVGSSWWWLACLGPALMFFLLYRVTGIPYAEAQALKSRGADYAQYQQTTSAFFPWFPRHSD